MYRKIKNNRPSLIVADEVVSMSMMDDNSAIKQIENSIQIAESRISQEICTNFFNDFKKKKNWLVTIANKTYIQSLFPSGSTIDVGDIVNAIEFVDDDWYLEFWYEHLWKILAEMTVYVATPTNYTRFTAQGEMLNNPSTMTNEGKGAVSAELQVVQWKMDKLYNDRIAPLLAGANKYLFDNRGNFRLVDCKKWTFSNSPTGVAVQRKTAWMTNIYKKDNQGECYQNKDV
jgi:hypothetical protein